MGSLMLCAPACCVCVCNVGTAAYLQLVIQVFICTLREIVEVVLGKLSIKLPATSYAIFRNVKKWCTFWIKKALL